MEADATTRNALGRRDLEVLPEECASVAEVAGALSLATDVAMGNSYEHGL
jgi:hypothetical protein